MIGSKNGLTVLRSDNYIGGMGAVVLANALKANSGLQELHIKGNELGDSGTSALSDALAGATSTRRLTRRLLLSSGTSGGSTHSTLLGNLVHGICFLGACNGARHRNACAEPCNDSMTADVAKCIPVWDKSSRFETWGLLQSGTSACMCWTWATTA